MGSLHTARKPPVQPAAAHTTRGKLFVDARAYQAQPPLLDSPQGLSGHLSGAQASPCTPGSSLDLQELLRKHIKPPGANPYHDYARVLAHFGRPRALLTLKTLPPDGWPGIRRVWEACTPPGSHQFSLQLPTRPEESFSLTLALVKLNRLSSTPQGFFGDLSGALASPLHP